MVLALFAWVAVLVAGIVASHMFGTYIFLAIFLVASLFGVLSGLLLSRK